VAAGIALAAVHPKAGGETYNLGRANTPTNLAWAASFAEHLNWPGDVQLAHPDVARGALAKAVSGLDLDYPLFIDNAKIRRRLGYAEVTDFDDALALTDGGGRDGAQGPECVSPTRRGVPGPRHGAVGDTHWARARQICRESAYRGAGSWERVMFARAQEGRS
jgi:hypothetical protein